MAPKFRGDSDDWLDSDETKNRSRVTKDKRKKKSEALPPEAANATVAEVFPNQCRVRLDDGSPEFLCSYRRADVMAEREGGYRERSPVAVGDRVKAERTSPDAGVIEAVCARSNFLARPAPGREGKKILHVLAANVDVLVIVASVAKPEFSPGLVDRFLVAAAAAGISPLLCISKIDLLSTEPKQWRLYEEVGVEIIEESAKRGDGIDLLREKLRGRTTVFCGHSGVGKTSLLSELIGRKVGAVGEISDATGKGRHTTTGAVMLDGPDHSRWIDTPGIREFGLFDVPPEKLQLFFPEFKSLECSREHGCLHEGEAGCLATSLARYASYRRILDSLRESLRTEQQ